MSTIDASTARARAKDAARLLATDPRVRLVFLFGSSVRPGDVPCRDVDLAILARPAIEFDERLRLMGELADRVGAEIDLVPLDEAGVVLAHEVADTGECLYAADEEEEMNFVTRARARYWDFKPYLDAQLRMAEERSRERRDGPAT